MNEQFKRMVIEYLGKSGVGNTAGNKGECVGLVMVYVARLGKSHIWGHAKDLYNNAKKSEWVKIKNSPYVYPEAGDIVFTDGRTGGGFGHTGIVTKVDVEKDTYTILEQNNRSGDNDPSCELTTYSNWGSVIGWIRPVEEVEGPDEGENALETKLEALEAELDEMRASRNTWKTSAKDWEAKYSQKVLEMNAVIETNEILENKVKVLEKEVSYMPEPVKETKVALLEAVKEPLRLLVLAVIPVAVTYLAGLDVTWAAPVVIVLRFIDKFIHELGKASNDERLIKGLTQF